MDGFHVAARLRAEHPDTFKLLRCGGGGAVFRTPAISNTQLSEQSVEFWDAGVADSDHQGESRQTNFHKRHYLVQCILREHWSATHQVLAAHSGAGQARQAGPGQLQQPGPELPAAVPR